MKSVLMALLIALIVFIGNILWLKLIYTLFFTDNTREYPALRARFGTVLWHSGDGTAPKNMAYHNYCYYPKQSAHTTLIIKRVDNGDCSDWYGQVILSEGSWVSEREKFYWSNGDL